MCSHILFLYVKVCRSYFGLILEEIFLLLTRWIHAMAAVIWVGGSLFVVLVLRTRNNSGGGNISAMSSAALDQFRGLVDSCIAVLVVTGTILFFNRITDVSTSSMYVITATVKIVISLWMIAIARRRWVGRRPTNTEPAYVLVWRRRPVAKVMGLMSGINMTILLGITVFFLSDLLAFIFEDGLTGR